MELIRKKIENREGYIEVETLGVIPVNQYNELTDPKWDFTLADYQEQINNIDLIFQDEKQRFQRELDELRIDHEKIKKEYNTDELKKLYLKSREAEKIAENKPTPKSFEFDKKDKVLSDPLVVKITSQIDYINKGICGKLNSNKLEIEKKEKELKNAENKKEIKTQEISSDLMTKRKPQNPDYQYYQGLKIIRQFTKHDYKLVDDGLVLLTDAEKLDIAKE